MRGARLFWVLVCCLLVSQLALAEVPRTISYQGVLRDSDGTVVADGPYGMTFRLYDTETGDIELWSEPQTVTVADGIFNAVLGSVQPLDLPFDGPYWLAISVAGSELGSRVQLTASPYALRAATADSVAGGAATPDGDWVVSGDDMYSAGSGHVGIGTASPHAPLHVEGCSATGTTLELVRADPNKKLLLGAISDETAGKIQAWDYGSKAALNLALQETGGRVGIGTAHPATPLHLYRNSSGTGSMDGMLVDQDGSGDAALSFRLIGQEQFVIGIDNSDGDKFKLSDGSDFGADRIVIDAAGNVGIGTASPEYTLHVQGSGRFTGGLLPGNTTFLREETATFLGGGGMPSGKIRCSTGDDFYIETVTANNNILLVPDGSGAVGIGTTNPQAKLHVDGDLCVTGEKNALVPTSAGMIKVYSEESAEVWFSDYGEAQLTQGRCHVELGLEFLEIVAIDSENPMKVFVQLNDACEGAYVDRGSTGFDVIEMSGGRSNAHFSYRVIAKRRGYEACRLESVVDGE